MQSIGIIGYGVVGKAIANTLDSSFKLVVYDKFGDSDSFSELKNCHFVFVSVPTPFDCKYNSVDDSAIIESLDRLARLNYEGIVIVKSTVPPGSCRKYSSKYEFDIVFNPEFLRESTSPNEDFKNQDTVVIGSDNIHIYDTVKNMYSQVLIPNAKYYHTSIEEAEMIKCSQNTMLACRVALANLIFDACKEFGLEYENIKNIAFDRFDIIGPHMSQVPGPDGSRGFGGKCLPKDTRAFNSIFNSKLLEEIISYNDSIRHDLHNFLENYESGQTEK